MKKIGLVGGVSWVSTADYYRFINEGVNKKLGGLNFSRCIINSLNYGDLVKNNHTNDIEANYKLVLEAVLEMERIGAQGIILGANTMHMFADRVQKEINIPIIHIAVETAAAITGKNIKKVGLLGTKYTMELDFFTSKLKDAGIEAIIPNEDDRQFIHNTIFEELSKGLVTDETRKRYITISQKLIGQGAEGIILGCTEIPLVIKPEDLPVPTFDTTQIHSDAAIEFSLSE